MSPRTKIRTIALAKSVRLSVLEDFIAPELQQRIMSHLLEESTFEQRCIRLFGKRVLQPRLIAWAGECPYRYSGDTLPPRPLPPGVNMILESVNSSLLAVAKNAPAFNHVLLNFYRDGRDSMGAHADDEPELGSNPFVASLSLGQERKFQIRLKKKFHHLLEEQGPPDGGPSSLDLPLKGGSLVIMHSPMQRYFLHGIPKQPKLGSSRLNLTFRSVLRSPKA